MNIYNLSLNCPFYLLVAGHHNKITTADILKTFGLNLYKVQTDFFLLNLLFC